MKVGFVLDRITPQSGGGYTIVNEIIEALSGVGPDINHNFVLFCREGQDMDRADRHIQYLPVRLPDKTVWQELKSTAKGKIRGLLQLDPVVEQDFESFIVKSGVDMMVYLGPLQRHVHDVPYITMVWDLQHRLQPFFPEVSSGGEWMRREREYEVNLRRATAVIVGTDAGRAEVERFYQVPSERIIKLPHPTPAFALRAPAGSGEETLLKFGIPKRYLFYPAQFWPHKNHAVILHAVRLLKESFGIDFHVVFVGSDQGNLDYVRRLSSSLGISGQVHFPGFVTQKEMIALYRNAFALTYLSFFGPENLPPLEAFALGCPVIASNVAGSDEQLGDAALLVDPTDERLVAEAIKSLCDNDNLRLTLVERGRDRASRFTGEDFLRGLLSFFDKFSGVRRCWSSDEPYDRPGQ